MQPGNFFPESFNLIVEFGRSSDLLQFLRLPIFKKTVTKDCKNLFRAYSCGNSLGISPNSLLIFINWLL